MRIVVALGGNALLRRGEPPTVEAQRANVARAAERLAPLAADHELIVTHGNGPQVGLLALEAAAYEASGTGAVAAYPLDVLGAESQGMVGYLLQEELAARLPAGRRVVTLLTTVAVDPDDPAFATPTKPIGPGYDAAAADALGAARGWRFALDGDRWRRVVPSPAPRAVLEAEEVALLVEAGRVVVCAGGGGVPVAVDAEGHRRGVEAVVDKDHASALLAAGLGADRLVLATDVDGAYLGFAGPAPRLVRAAHPDALTGPAATAGTEFAAGSMGPKVAAAATFARATGHDAVIGALDALDALVLGGAGTRITVDVAGLELAEAS